MDKTYKLETPIALNGAQRQTIDAFHREYHESGVEGRCYWLGHRMYKTPTDLFTFQEIIFDTRPDLIIELGTFYGGSAMFMATVLDQLNKGLIVSVDVAPKATPAHSRIQYITGDCQGASTHERVKGFASQAESVMLILDCDHSADHVANELQKYAPLVTTDCYLIVEDTCVGGNPIEPDFGDGPSAAVRKYMNSHAATFAVDRTREKYLLTYHSGGYLRRM